MTTEPQETPKPSRIDLTALFFILFLATGLVMSLFSMAKVSLPQNQSVLKGEWTTAYEEAYNEKLPTRQASITTWGVLEYSLFKNGRDGVLVGRDGWLYSSEEFVYYPKGREAVQKKLKLAKRTRASLAEQGVKLLIVLVPAKARIYPEHSGRYTFPSYNQALYANFILALEEVAIPYVNLLDTFEKAKSEQAVFLKTDTHWTPYGAELAAREIADVARKQDLLPSLGSSIYETTLDSTEAHKGDLLNFLPLGRLQTVIGPSFDRLEVLTTEQASQSEVGGLFGNVSIPVTLVGTSYSANAKWNFEGALKEALGTDIFNVADEGAGPVFPLENYLRGDEFATSSPELVIWELPERFLSVEYGR